MKEMLDKNSQLRLLYVTPEKCSKSKQFMAKLQKMYQMGRLNRIAIGGYCSMGDVNNHSITSFSSRSKKVNVKMQKMYSRGPKF
jgi:hypothetical protein